MKEAKPTTTLAARIASLSTLSRQDLWKVWDEHFPASFIAQFTLIKQSLAFIG